MNTKKTINVLFCGTGGQGVLKAAEVLGWAAVYEGCHTKKSEVHGMAQRGGSVESHLRFGAEVFSPLIPYGEADYLISFQRGEHDRMQGFLKKGGADLVNGLAAAEKNSIESRYLNTYLLGVLSKYLEISEENWIKAMAAVFPANFIDKNREVFMAARSNG